MRGTWGRACLVGEEEEGESRVGKTEEEAPGRRPGNLMED